MSEITAVPLRPVPKGSIAALWGGIALLVAAGAGTAWYGTRSQVAMARPAEDFLSGNARADGVVQTASGLQYKVLKAGKGTHPGANDGVLVNYEGRLVNGDVFDSTARTGQPAVLPVGGMIPGWTEGLQLMAPGAKYRFWIPPQLAYGERGAGGVIPPNAITVFDVELLGIVPPGMSGAGGAPTM